MPVVVDGSFVGSLLPENLASVTVQAKDFDRVAMISAVAVGMAIHFAVADVSDGFRARDGCPFERSGQKDFLAPDDGRRMPPPWNRGLPLNVLGVAPFSGQILFGRDAVASRPAPLRPVRFIG